MKHTRSLITLGVGLVAVVVLAPPSQAKRIVLQGQPMAQQQVMMRGCFGGEEWYGGGMVQGVDVPVKFELDLPTAETDDTLTDYRAALERGDTVGALRLLDTLREGTNENAGKTLLVPDGEGRWIGPGPLVSRLQRQLSPSQRDTYILMHGAQAEQAVKDAAALQGAEREAALRAVVEGHFVTPAAADAGDTLAELRLESGDFRGAAGMWGLLLDAHPSFTSAGSDTRRAMLELKRITALTRAGLHDQAEHERADLARRSGEMIVTAGGSSGSVAQQLASLTATSTSTAGGAEGALGLPDIDLPPTGDQPMWDHTLKALADTIGAGLNDEDRQALQNQGLNVDAWLQGQPATATDGRRVYVATPLGLHALDARSGDLAWSSIVWGQSDKGLAANARVVRSRGGRNVAPPSPLGAMSITTFTDAAAGVNATSDSTGDHQAAGDGRVGVVFPRPDAPQILTASMFDAENGRLLWTLSTTAPDAGGFPGSNWSLASDLVAAHGEGEVGSLLVAAAVEGGGTRVGLVAIDAASGKVVWGLPLGMAQIQSPNMAGYQVRPGARVVVADGTAYVQVGSGATAAVDLTRQAVVWARAGESTLRLMNNPQTGQWTTQNTGLGGPSDGTTLLLADGVLYAKDAGSDEMTAIDAADGTLLWRAEADRAATGVEVDATHIVLVGPEQTVALDRRTGEHAWASPFTGGATNLASGRDHVAVATKHGLLRLQRVGGKADALTEPSMDDPRGGALLVPRGSGRVIYVGEGRVRAWGVGGTQ